MADLPISVYISYSRTDGAFIDRMEADLHADGFDTWVDRQHIEGGTDWARLIEQEILKREAIVVSLSPDAVTSIWVLREIRYALNAGKHVIPIIVRPVERVPFAIVEKHDIVLDGDYARGLQELRVALLKTRTLPTPPSPAQVPKPLLAMPDVSGDPLRGLVQIPALPPALNPDLSTAFMQAQSSLGHDNLDLAEALLRQIVEQQSDFGYGLAAQEPGHVRKELEPKQIERLLAMANEAWPRGAWGQAIGALRALMERLPQNKELPARLAQAEVCQKWAWLYENARVFAQAGDVASTRVALQQLWIKAPGFGDPAHIVPQGVVPPSPPVDLATVHLVDHEDPLPPSDHPRLVLQTGRVAGKRVTITTVPFKIGPSRDVDFFTEELSLSRVQASISRNDVGK